ncbi:MAG: T9SS type A sorting domain-containing protein [Candidatus Krumholzibacteria bacterium]|nr:T9SS type A sorting domain-containing protein [Candidatus Krumholzibacteria bacterium]
MRSRSSYRTSAFVLATVCLAALAVAQSPARERAAPLPAGGGRDPLGILVLDGSGVHDVGELHMHTGNWGAFGSYPSSMTPISQYPSAEWPAGSVIEHLNIAGLWVGAVKGCSALDQTIGVSTAAYEMEFRPTDDPIDRIYETYEGAQGGSRLPSPYADDDGDGLVDEDPLDGRDNDGDGLVDEDFAAISEQMFSSWYTDDRPEAIVQYPDHTPLGIKIRQESYQWTDPRFDDFVGVSFSLSNIGTECLGFVFVGLFLDFDIGSRDDEQYWEDDGAGYWEGIRYTDLGPASISVAYMYGTGEGEAASYIGAMILGHPTDTGETASIPDRVGATAFRVFSGDQPYENGGDPANDFQRYEAMSQRRIDRNASVPRDYRVLVSVGPFELPPYSPDPLGFHVGFVCGATLEEMLDNAAMCQKLFDGLWFDIDGDPLTGVDGRETQVNWIYEEPEAPQAHLDIRPGSCPNPFNVKVFDFLAGGNPNRGGVIPVAVLGSEGFDVRDIDIGTVRLEGVEPLGRGWGYEDVSSPAHGGEPCECAETGPDGYEDLVLKFGAQRIAAALLHFGLPEAGQEATLVLRGNLEGGAPFEAADCIVYVGPPPQAERGGREMLAAEYTRLLEASPNPFNPSTTIRFELASPGRVTLAVYDVGGRLVRVLVDRTMSAGRHEAMWDGRGAGGAFAASGVYFYRLTTQGFVETRKMVRLK